MKLYEMPQMIILTADPGDLLTASAGQLLELDWNDGEIPKV